MKLLGKTTLVTGAASGIGRATCSRFAAEGARLICIDIDAQGLEVARQDLGHSGEGAMCITADVSDARQVQLAIDRVFSEFASVDVLVNIAGRGCDGDAATLDEQAWDACLAVNLKSVFLMVKALWPRFVAQRSGVILNTSSVMGLMGSVNSLAYSAAKAAVINLTRCLAADGGPYGIRANCVCPGFVDTPVMAAVFDAQADPRAAERRLSEQLPLRRMASPAEAAAAFTYLASDDAAYVTGTEIVVDGGISSLLRLRV